MAASGCVLRGSYYTCGPGLGGAQPIHPLPGRLMIRFEPQDCFKLSPGLLGPPGQSGQHDAQGKMRLGIPGVILPPRPGHVDSLPRFAPTRAQRIHACGRRAAPGRLAAMAATRRIASIIALRARRCAAPGSCSSPFTTLRGPCSGWSSNNSYPMGPGCRCTACRSSSFEPKPPPSHGPIFTPPPGPCAARSRSRSVASSQSTVW